MKLWSVAFFFDSIPPKLHICVSESGQHWFRWWLLAYSVPSHYLNQCWSIGPLGTNSYEILIKIQNFSFTKMHLKISSVKWQPFCPGGDELSELIHNGLAIPDGTESLPEPVLTYAQSSPVTVIWAQFNKSISHQNKLETNFPKISFKFQRGSVSYCVLMKIHQVKAC